MRIRGERTGGVLGVERVRLGPFPFPLPPWSPIAEMAARDRAQSASRQTGGATAGVSRDSRFEKTNTRERTWIHMRWDGCEGKVGPSSVALRSARKWAEKGTVQLDRSKQKVEPLFVFQFHSQIAPDGRNQVAKIPKWRNTPPIHNRPVLR